MGKTNTNGPGEYHFHNGFQFLPHLHHREGVELAVAEQGFAGCGGFRWSHLGDGREEVHCVTAVLAEVAERVVVQRRIIREQGREDALDAEGAAHSRDIVVTGTERVDEVLDVVGDIAKMVRQRRESVGQFPQAAALESLIVG